jgi:hypothetical protein
MRRVRLIRDPEGHGRPVRLAELAREGTSSGQEAMLYFRHRCDDEWFESLIEAQGLRGKRLNPARLRRLLLGALKKREEEA